MVSEPVHKYSMGLVGNCSFLAYIDTLAHVQWLCMPRFDKSFVFGPLLDKKKGGEFSITPATDAFSTKQYYQKNTNILCTEFETGNGLIKVTDFAPRFYHFERFFKPLMLVRKIEALSGLPVVRVVCDPKGDYGKLEPDTVIGSNHIRYLNLESQVRLTTDIPLNYIFERKPFVLNEVCYCVFTYGEPLEAPLASTAEEFLQKTQRYWNAWVKATSIPPLYQEEVIRSALVLKLNQYEDTGGIIAAGTTSLPEYNGSGRNWDYRYCWLRDSYYTLNAFNNIGHFEESEKFFRYIQNIVISETDDIQPVYGITGDKNIIETELPLSGYLDNLPVRKGNNAFLQRQNDVYGQLLCCLLPLYTDERLDTERHQRQYHLIARLLGLIEKTMDLPDSGIWEYRNSRQFHCFTYLFHWAGCKAAFKIARVMHDVKCAEKAQLLATISARKIEQCYNDRLGGYTQAIGVETFDASTLQLITMRYLDPASQKAAGQISALEKRLKMPNGLIYRYFQPDDLGVPRTSFLVCSFWYAEALACMGRLDEAIIALDQALKCVNHLGLLSEDADDHFGQWGNFPQTYSHVGLVNAVYRIAGKVEKPLFY
jgi:GH15 family glucan-1,4-alpha-glucosidase